MATISAISRSWLDDKYLVAITQLAELALRREANEERPQAAEDWFRLAVRHEDAGALAKAAGCYRQAMLLAEPDKEIYYRLGVVLYASGEAKEAIECFRLAVALEPEFAEAWLCLGNALGEQGRCEEAIEAQQNALAINSEDPEAHLSVAQSYEQAGLMGQARKHWRAYLHLAPKDFWSDLVRQRLEQPQLNKSA